MNPLTENDIVDRAELRERRINDACTTWIMTIAISAIAIFALPRSWEQSLVCWICGGGFLATYEGWRKRRNA